MNREPHPGTCTHAPSRPALRSWLIRLAALLAACAAIVGASDGHARAALAEADPVQQNPVQQNPVQQNPVEQNPVEQNPVEQNPVEQNPVEQNPVEQNPVEQNPVEQARGAFTDRSGALPWYDPQTDALRRRELEINEEKPVEESKSSPEMPSGTLGVLEILVWILAAALVFIICYALIMAYLKRETQSLSPTSRGQSQGALDKGRVGALPVLLPKTNDNLLDVARRFYEQGNYRDAIIHLYSHELLELDKARVIRLVRGKTNRQYLKETGRHARLKSLLEASMVAFEDVYFGAYELTRARFESCWRAVDEFTSQIRALEVA